MWFSKRVFKVFQPDMHQAWWESDLKRRGNQSLFAGQLFDAHQVLKTPHSLPLRMDR